MTNALKYSNNLNSLNEHLGSNNKITLKKMYHVTKDNDAKINSARGYSSLQNLPPPQKQHTLPPLQNNYSHSVSECQLCNPNPHQHEDNCPICYPPANQHQHAYNQPQFCPECYYGNQNNYGNYHRHYTPMPMQMPMQMPMHPPLPFYPYSPMPRHNHSVKSKKASHRKPESSPRIYLPQINRNTPSSFSINNDNQQNKIVCLIIFFIS